LQAQTTVPAKFLLEEHLKAQKELGELREIIRSCSTAEGQQNIPEAEQDDR
jgi:hypothetical protein